MDKQLDLFNIRPAYRVEQPKELMSKDALLKYLVFTTGITVEPY